MRDFIVLVILIWVLCMMVGGRKAANGAVALIGGAIIFVMRSMGAIITWIAQAILIVLLFLALSRFLRRITGYPRRRRHHGYHNRYNPYHDDDLPPMPPL